MRILYSFFLVAISALSLTAQDCPPVSPTPSPTEDFVLTPLATYSTGIFDEGAAEIVSYDPISSRLVFTNADANSISILDISDPTSPTLLADVSPMTDDLGGVNSVTVADGLIAAAYQGVSTDSPGAIILMDIDGTEITRFPTGPLPDMIIYDAAGQRLLTANEGEPNDDYTVDPSGSVTVVDLSGGTDAATAVTVSLDVFNDQRWALTQAGVRLFGPGASVGQDLEPEYISVDGNQAFVSLQENNAFAILDLNTLTFTDIIPLGYKDHSCEANALDASNRDDAINIAAYPILGMYQPDAIECVSIDGTNYIVTANEGDSRDYDGYSEETRIADLVLDPDAYPNAAELQENEVLGRLNTTTATGDADCDGDIDQIFTYGARSFSIFTTDGQLVYDSGSDFERILADILPTEFNSNNDENDSFDARSDDKGPEPEAVEVFVRNGQVYAMIGLERIGGIMTYNISDPENPVFVSYFNNRDFTVDAQLEDDSTNPAVGDLGTEDIIYISADDSPNGEELVVTANEISGTITLFTIGEPTFALRLIHNNDGESKIVPSTLEDGTSFGGAARFAFIVDSLRSQDVATITLSSGDNFLPGTAFNASLARAEGLPLYDSEVLNTIGYDALVIGNHDFDFGPDILQRVIEETAPTNPTFLSANLDFSGEPGLQALFDAGRIAKGTIVMVNGDSVGVVGLTTPALPTISSPRNVTVDNMIRAAAQTEVDALTAEGVNKIILISHLQSINEELALAGELTDVDVIIAGGGDELLTNDPANALGGQEVFASYPIDTLDADGNTVYVVTTPGEYRFVGNLLIEFNDAGEVVRIADESDVIPVLGDEPVNPEIAAIQDSIELYNAGLGDNVIAITEVDLDGLRTSIRTMETNLGNLIADAYLWYFADRFDEFDFDPNVPVISVQNGGGIRNNNIIAANSELTELTTFEILPFSNFVSVLEPISPTELKSVLENGVSRIEFGDGRFLQVGGFSVVYDSSAMAGVNQIIDVTLDDGTIIVEDGVVSPAAPDVYVVTNSFTAAGGDDFDEFAALSFQNIGPSYQRVLFEYLLAEDGVNGVVTAEAYPAGGEGRIVELTTSTDGLNLDDLNFSGFPNPFGNEVNISFDLPGADFLEVGLYDVSGQLVTMLTSGQAPGGTNTLTANTNGLPAGSYVLLVQYGNRIGSAQLIKQ